MAKSPLSVAVCAGLLGLVLSLPAYALRCGTYVVSKKAHITEVIEKCGEPDFEQSRTEYITTYVALDNSTTQVHTDNNSQVTRAREVTEELKVTELVYNFGVERLKRRLRFVNGYLEKVTQLKRGSPR